MRNFLSYGKQWIEDDDIKNVIEVLQSDFLTQGPKVEEFEEEICKLTGAKYCVVLSSGTAALHLAVHSLNIEKGKKGITSPNTFVASSNAFIYNGLFPDFADIDPKTYNINYQEICKRLNDDVKVIITVHFAGQPADMENINKIAKSKGVFIIEDAAHAIGSKYSDGSMVGNCKYSDMTIFSFHPVKTITTGEGGAITTNNIKFYEELKLLRSHGITKDINHLNQNPGPWYYEMCDLGYHYRLTDLQSALGISQIKKLGKFVRRRREIVNKYNNELSKNKFIQIPFETKECYSAFHLYVIKIDFEKLGKIRKEVMEELKNKNVGTQVHYIPVHTQPYYLNNYGFKPGDYPIAEDYYRKALSIPLYPKMTDEDVDYVIRCIMEVVC